MYLQKHPDLRRFQSGKIILGILGDSQGGQGGQAVHGGRQLAAQIVEGKVPGEKVNGRSSEQEQASVSLETVIKTA